MKMSKQGLSEIFYYTEHCPEELISSKLRNPDTAKVLREFVVNPEEEIKIRDLKKRLKISDGKLNYHVRKLEKDGWISTESYGTRKITELGMDVWKGWIELARLFKKYPLL